MEMTFSVHHTQSHEEQRLTTDSNKGSIFWLADQGGETGSEVSGADPQSHYFKHPKYKVINLRFPAAGQQVTNCWESDL